MIADVTRAYNPNCSFFFNGLQQQTIANLQARTDFPFTLLKTTIPISQIHRKIWCWFWSISPTWSADVDLVFWTNQREVFRQKILFWNTAAVNLKFAFCISQQSQSYGSVNEQLIIVVASTTIFGVAPHRLNIAADSVGLYVNSVSGAAATFDAGLHVQSQAGL